MAKKGARWSLAELAAAMERPAFTPYLGRKSCPLGLPLAPTVIEAEGLLAALLNRRQQGPEAAFLRRLKIEDVEPHIVLDADLVAPGDKRHLRTEWRRDAPLSRSRWQFGLRAEAVLAP